MAITWTDARLNAMADEDATACAYGSLHTASPGSTGTNEATGGGYTREALTWSAGGAEGPLGASVQPATVGVAWAAPTFDLAAGSYTHGGMWDDLTGNWLGGGALATTVTLGADGTQQVSFAVGPNA